MGFRLKDDDDFDCNITANTDLKIVKNAFFNLQIGTWAVLSLNLLLILYGFYLMIKLFTILKCSKQATMI